MTQSAKKIISQIDRAAEKFFQTKRIVFSRSDFENISQGASRAYMFSICLEMARSSCQTTVEEFFK